MHGKKEPVVRVRDVTLTTRADFGSESCYYSCAAKPEKNVTKNAQKAPETIPRVFAGLLTIVQKTK